MKKVGLLSLLFLSLITLGFADDLDDLMGAFDQEEDINTTVVDVVQEEASWLSLSGDYTFSTAYNYDGEAFIKGLSRLRSTLNLTLDMEFSKYWRSKVEMKALGDPIYKLRDIRGFTETLEDEKEFKEAYIQGSMGNFDLKIGRQIIVWGKSDNIRITDVINPLDNREIGMVDIENLRLPVNSSKLSYFRGDYAFKIAVIHEARVQKEAGVGSEFFPSAIFPPAFVIPPVIDPESDRNSAQYTASVDGTFSGWDISFYAAKVLDQRWHLDNSKSVRIYTPIKMSGFALNIASGSWVFKTESALLEALHYNTTSKEKSRLDSLVGLEYSGVKDVTTSFEVANRHIFDYEPQMLFAPDYVRKNEMQTAFRSSYTFDHDNARLSYLVTVAGYELQDGGFQRFWLDYDYSDIIKLTAGFIDYFGGEKPYLKAISVNDRLFFDFKYSF